MTSFTPTRRTLPKDRNRRNCSCDVCARSSSAGRSAGRRSRAVQVGEDQLAAGTGETITVAVIPASYFDNLIALAPQFEALTGIKVRFEKIPPGQIRQKACSTCRRRPAPTRRMPPTRCTTRSTSRTNGSSRSTRYLNDSVADRRHWFNFDDIIKAWRDANSIDGKPYGMPYDGEVTVQVYRKDLYDAKGLKPADTLDELRRRTPRR